MTSTTTNTSKLLHVGLVGNAAGNGDDNDASGSIKNGATNITIADHASNNNNNLRFEIDVSSLTKHAIILGATGSGKTVLSKVLVEEAVLQGIPTFAIDPKGDIGNLAFKSANFDFSKWSDKEADALKVDRQQYAANLQKMYGDKMKEFAVRPDAPAEFSRNVIVRIFTPKSSAGLAAGISPDLSAPKGFSELLCSDVSAAADLLDLASYNLLRLAGYNEDDRKEITFISALLEDAWKSGRSVTVKDLIRWIESPPINTVGSLHVSDVLSDKDRRKLVTKINLLVSDPKLRSWSEAKSLDFSELMKGHAINVLDLRNIQSEQEKHLFVELVLQQLFAWLIKQGSAQTLRYLLYFDEIAGYCPPIREPPSKKLLLMLIKQARAFGLGLILASQNAVDLDYKVISNANVRFIGRLGAQRDIQRVSVGLELDSFAEREISRLKAGEFFCNIFDPQFRGVIRSRWPITYHRGPLENNEIADLMVGEKAMPKKRSSQIPAMGEQTTASTAVVETNSKRRNIDKNDFEEEDIDGLKNIDSLVEEKDPGSSLLVPSSPLLENDDDDAASPPSLSSHSSSSPPAAFASDGLRAAISATTTTISFMQLERKFEPKNLQEFAKLGNNVNSIKVLSVDSEDIYHPVFELSASVYEKSYANQSLDKLEELAAFESQLLALPAAHSLLPQRTISAAGAAQEMQNWRGELEKKTSALEADLQDKFNVLIGEKRIERILEKQSKPKSRIADIDAAIAKLQHMLNADLDSVREQEEAYKILKKQEQGKKNTRRKGEGRSASSNNSNKSRLISIENRIETRNQKIASTRRKIEQLYVNRQALEEKLDQIEQEENEKFHNALGQVKSKSSFAITGWLVETVYRARILINNAKEHSGDVKWSSYTGKGTWGRCSACSIPLEDGSTCSCGNLMCNFHLAYCKTCLAPACMEHRVLCYICKSFFCSNHGAKCELCGSFVCTSHSGTCSVCNRKACNKCSQKKGLLIRREIVCRLCSG